MSLNCLHCPLRYAWCCNTSKNLKNKQTVYLITEEKDVSGGKIPAGERTHSTKCFCWTQHRNISWLREEDVGKGGNPHWGLQLEAKYHGLVLAAVGGL